MLALNVCAKQRGETLTGLLVGLAVGLLVLAAGSLLLAHVLRGQRQAVQDSHLQQDLHFALDWVAGELADAQYSASAASSRSPRRCSDAFCDDSEDLGLSEGRIDWSIDRNHNGSQDNNECFGLRLRSSALQVRTSCTPEVWTALSDTRTVRVQALRVSLRCTAQNGWIARHVTLEIDAAWPQDAQRLTTLQRHITLRNALPQAVQARYCP